MSENQIHGLHPEQPGFFKKRRGKRKKDHDDYLSVKVRDCVPNSKKVTFLGLSLHAALRWKQWVAETEKNGWGN